MKRICTFAAVLFALTTAGLAQAYPVNYVFTGTANGSVGGTNFTGQTYTFSVVGDSSTVQNSAAPFSNVLNRASVTISGTACAAGCTITSPGNYLVFNDSGPALIHGISVVGNLNAPGFTLIEGCWNCGGATINDNLVQPVAPIPSGDQGALAPYATFATSGGNVQLTVLGGAITYSVQPSASIPTLSQWALIALSVLLAMGSAVVLRRRYR